MLFQRISLEDIELLRPYLSRGDVDTCDYTLGGVFMWRDYFKIEYAIENGVLYSRLNGPGGERCNNLPLGADMEGALAGMLERAGAEKRTISFCTVPRSHLHLFHPERPGVSVTEQRNFFDYCYLASDLAQLKGKKYSGQRNQISHFLRYADSWELQPLEGDRREQAKAFFEETFSGEAPTAAETAEHIKVLEVLDNMERYGMSGSVLSANGRIVGFALGEVVGCTLYIHIEKADRTVAGAYQMLVREFAARYAEEGIIYINREDDNGDGGLRKSKLSYHPCRLIEKYLVEIAPVQTG